MADITIPVGFVDKFNSDLILLAQQKESRFADKVRTDPDMLQGRFGYFDRIGKVAMKKRTTRHGETVPVEIEHTRRRITLTDYELPQWLDKQDVMRLLADPQGKYLQAALAAANRQKDDVIIAAATADVYSMDEDMAATATVLPSSQQIANGGTGLTLTKLLQANEILAAADLDPDMPKNAFVSAKQITNMLNTTEVKNADYNSIKALVEGKVDTFLGFKFTRTERLGLNGAGIRRNLFFYPQAIGLAVGEDITTTIDRLPTRGNLTQILTTISADAARIEDEAIVVVDCQET